MIFVVSLFVLSHTFFTEKPVNIFDAICSDAGLIELIQKAVLTTLKVYTSSDVEVRPAIHQEKGNSNSFVVGVVTLRGEKGSGKLGLSLSESAFATIYENMFGDKPAIFTLEDQTLAGELINIIFQTIDPELRTRGHFFDVSLPDVLAGDGLLQWHKPPVKRSILLPFVTAKGELYFEIPEIHPD